MWNARPDAQATQAGGGYRESPSIGQNLDHLRESSLEGDQLPIDRDSDRLERFRGRVSFAALMACPTCRWVCSAM